MKLTLLTFMSGETLTGAPKDDIFSTYKFIYLSVKNTNEFLIYRFYTILKCLHKLTTNPNSTLIK